MVNRTPSFFSACFVILFCLCCFFNLYSETVYTVGDYTTPGIIDGDLVLTNGAINITSPGDFIVNGDLKISSGSVFIGPSSGKLQVFGDLIVSNTLSDGNAFVIVHDDIDVGGAIITRSLNGEANITTTGASSGAGKINAGQIVAFGVGKANVLARGLIAVASGIDLKSTTSDAYIESLESNVNAGSVTTDAYNKAYCLAKKITVLGHLNTRSSNGEARVESTVGDIYSGTITTSGYSDSSVVAQSSIDVVGSIFTKSVNDVASVSSAGGSVIAGAIAIDGYGLSDVSVTSGDIIVRGSISTKSKTSYARVLATNGDIFAGEVSTYALDGEAFVSGRSIDVDGNITTSSDTHAYVTSSVGDIKAFSIVTIAGGDAYISSNSEVDIIGIISTNSDSGSAYISSSNNSDIKALSIFTNGSGAAYISSAKDILVKGFIKTKSSGGLAYVRADDAIAVEFIQTDGATESYILSDNDSITVDASIFTKSASGSAYVRALNGNITAGRIKTEAVAGQDDSIQSAAGSGEFQLVLNEGDGELTIKDAEFYFDRDYVWNTQLTLHGTCTINGNGYELTFDDSGGITVTTGASLLLKNIKLNKLSGEVVKCFDDTATLSLDSVVLTQTSDYDFKNGSIQFVGDCLIKGCGTTFGYESSLPSTIHADSTLFFDTNVTFSYASTSSENIEMVDSTSRLNFFGSTLSAIQNVRFTKGTLVFDDIVTFSTAVGKVICLESGVALDNINFEYHAFSQINALGTIVNACV